MYFFIVENKQKLPMRIFANSDENAKNIAVAAHHTDKPENIDIIAKQSICDQCFTIEGAASYRIDPEHPELDGWYAIAYGEAPVRQAGFDLQYCIHRQ